MSITNYLNKIKTAVYGRDVRGAIHDAIKECYDDASVNHDNANMEVKMARGTHNTLNDRLDESDEIQAQTNAQLSEVKKRVKEYPVTLFNSFQECHDFCLQNNGIMRIPSGEYELNESLVIKGVSVIGDGANTTTIILNGCDGFILDSYDTQAPVEVGGLSFTASSSNKFDLTGIRFKEQVGGVRSRGYKIRDCYFEGLGCSIMVTDSFRTQLSSIHINNCFLGVKIYGQAVQCYLNDVISNCDLLDETESSLSDVKYGIWITPSSHTGATLRPESIRCSNVAMVNHDTNLYLDDALYTSFSQCDFDLSRKECIITNSVDGCCTISDSWISTRSLTTEPIIRIKTSAYTHQRLVIKNNSISVLVNGNKDKVAIYADNYREGLEIIGNSIKSYTTVNLKHGIYFDQARDCIVKDNVVQNTSDYGIYVNDSFRGQYNGNVTNKIFVNSNVSDNVSVTGNYCPDGIELTGVANYGVDYQKVKTIRLYAPISANGYTDVNHGFNTGMDGLIVQLFRTSTNGRVLATDFSVTQVDANVLRIKNDSQETREAYVVITRIDK